MLNNRNPLEKKEPMPVNAKLLYRLLKFKESGRHIDLWMTFPQHSCCFAFGQAKGPVPIGALFLLWSAGWPYLQECPECHRKAYMVAFGGLLSVGGGTLICPTCGSSWFQFLGGLGVVANEYIRKSPLVETEFCPTGIRFGGACSSEGEALRKFLYCDDAPEPGIQVSLSMEGQRFSLGFEFDQDQDQENRANPRD